MGSDDLSFSLTSLTQKSKSYREKLDLISAEIKQLETTLNSLDVGAPASVNIGRQALTPSEREAVGARRVPGWQFLSAFANESISWDRDQQSGKFRLLYVRTVSEDRVATSSSDAPTGAFSTSAVGCNEFPDGETERKPLIECPIEIRLRAWPELNQLVQAIEGAIDGILTKSESAR